MGLLSSSFGIIRRRKKEKNNFSTIAVGVVTAADAYDANDNTESSLFTKNKKNKRKKKRKKKRKNKNKKKHDYGPVTTTNPRAATVVTLDHVPDLIHDLETAVIVNAKRPMRALQMLFKLSSSGRPTTSSNINTNTTRIGMVHQKIMDNDDGSDNERYRYGQQLVLTLLRYIKRCTPQSNEHNLALIVLNNISIPPENKKTIALDCNGIEILSRLLCEDPSCHLIAIVLVNLTYDFGGGDSISGINGSSSSTSSSSSSFRKQLLDCNDKTSLIESLAFALRVSSLTSNEYEARQTTIDECTYSDESYLSPVIRLSILMAKDHQLRSSSQQQQQQQQQPSTKEEILLQLRSNEEELQQLDKLVRLSSLSSSSSSMKMDRCRNRGENKTHSRRRRHRHDHPPPRPSSPSSITMKDDDEEEEEKLNDYDHDYLYPETTKWCLYALRNLSQPLSSVPTSTSVCNNDDNDDDDNDLAATSIVANILIKSGIYSLILQQFVNTSVTVVSSVRRRSSQSATLYLPIATSSCESSTTASSSSSSNTTMTNNDNNNNGPHSNNNNLTLLLQDTAISIILNLSACTKSREYMNEPETIRVLTTQCNNGSIICFQRLKARMALSYLIGSQGHFGQPKLRSIASTVQANRKNSALILSSHTEVDLLLELLVNTLYHRGKDSNSSGGGGGYLVGAFNLKCVLFSLRCLLTHTTNQETIAKSIGLDLNTILMNILARYAFDEKEDGRSIIDSDSADHIVFCLYLQSNYGFAGFGDQEMSSFLPDMYAPPTSRILDDVDHDLAANILTTYLRRSEDNYNKYDASVKTSAGCHAAKELLLRLKYMNFRNHNPNACRKTYRVIPEGLKINYILLAKIKRVRIPDRKHGSKPNPIIFHHPVLRYQKPLSTQSGRMPLWNNYNPAAVSNFANVLLAVQQLSYGSIKGRRSSQYRNSSVPIDDIAIANKIVHCANNKMEVCYNFMWAWEDFKIKDTHEDEDADDDTRDSNKSNFTSQGLFGCVEGIDSHIPIKSRTTQKPLGPMSFWGGVICCAMDDSMNGDDDDDTTLYTR